MAVYDRQNLDHMRREARERSYVMHSRSQSSPNNTYTDEGAPGKDDEKKKDRTVLDEFLGGKLDKDKLLIAALLFLLLREGGDKKLILALGYILL